jgi:hypothetical protein
MLTYDELVASIKQLSINERLDLIEVISRSVREELIQPLNGITSQVPRPSHPYIAREELVQPLSQIATAEQMRGMAKPTKGSPPDDTELSESYTDYLIAKYQ